jgi:hypothetical protein
MPLICSNSPSPGMKVELIRQRKLVSPAVGQQLNRAVRDRNKLAHWYSIERTRAMETPDGQLRIAAELREVAARLVALSTEIESRVGELTDSAVTRSKLPLDSMPIPDVDAIGYVVVMIKESRQRRAASGHRQRGGRR